ncbi:MAG: helix-turn-helix transcriptional regulator [Clostridia bacterium]|nr:helix-turn-helix transcriptional regulator [Clostridia bacterium]
MDQIKIGFFIKAERRRRGLTQRALADMLGVSDKAVSKWETGSGLPDVSLMMPLCEILEISVNELLSAERLDQNQYRRKAEENIMSMIEKKQRDAKRLMVISFVLVGISLIATIGIVLLAGLATMEDWVRILLLICAMVQMLLVIGVAAAIEMKIGSFECTKCGALFVPTAKQYLMGAHTITRRRLTCPKCGKRSYCIKRLASPESENDSGTANME